MTLVYSEINFETQAYSEEDIMDSYNFMKEMFPDEVKKYEEERENREFVEDDCLEIRTFTFDYIYTQMSDDGEIDIFVYLDENNKEFLVDFDMNKNMDITIKYQDRIPVDVSFFNEESGGNLKCTVEWDTYLYLTKKDEHLIKKQIEAILLNIDDYRRKRQLYLDDYDYYCTDDYLEFLFANRKDIEESKKLAKEPDNRNANLENIKDIYNIYSDGEDEDEDEPKMEILRVSTRKGK